jgi:hypothetical protein
VSLKADENGAKEMKPVTAVQHDEEEADGRRSGVWHAHLKPSL